MDDPVPMKNGIHYVTLVVNGWDEAQQAQGKASKQKNFK